MTDVPDAGYVAALAGFRGMTPRRLRILLDHLAPRDAFEVASGAAAPTPLVARLLTDELRGWWRQSAAERSPASCWERCNEAGVDVVTAGDPQFPALLGLDPSPPAVLFVRGDLGVLDAPACGHRRHPQRDAGRSPDRGRARLRPRRRRGRGGLRARQGDRRRGASRCARGRRARSRSRTPRGGRRQRRRPAVPEAARRALERGLRTRRAHVGVAAGHAARGVPVPDAQPDPGRAVRGAGRRRESRTGRQPAHRARGPRPFGRGDGGARLTAEPGGGGHQRVAARRRRPGHIGRRRARRRSASTRGARAPLRSTRGHHCEASIAPSSSTAGRIHERSTTSPARSDLALCEAAMTLARLERAGWVREVGGWFEAIWSRSELR